MCQPPKIILGAYELVQVKKRDMECHPLHLVSATQDHYGSRLASPGKPTEGGGEEMECCPLYCVSATQDHSGSV